MKKIPTIFVREFIDNRTVKILPEIKEGLEEVLYSGIPTVKWDGSCCAIIGGKFYKRYDAKNGKPVPAGAIKCQEEADPITGHLPCWVEVDKNNPADKWFMNAYRNSIGEGLTDGTYEAVGKHFNGNPYFRKDDMLIRHGCDVVEVGRSFDEIKEFLRTVYIEGLVFWLNGEPKAKIKRSDFGFYWNVGYIGCDLSKGM